MSNPITRWLVHPSAERDVVREGIDALLEHADYKDATIHLVEISDSWTTIWFLGGKVVSAQVAIWNATGNAYRVGTSGAVEDDPFIVIEAP